MATRIQHQGPFCANGTMRSAVWRIFIHSKKKTVFLLFTLESLNKVNSQMANLTRKCLYELSATCFQTKSLQLIRSGGNLSTKSADVWAISLKLITEIVISHKEFERLFISTGLGVIMRLWDNAETHNRIQLRLHDVVMEWARLAYSPYHLATSEPNWTINKILVHKEHTIMG